MSELLIFLIGFMVGGFILFNAGMLVIKDKMSHDNMVDLEELRQAEQDCKIKEYYYMDEHRTFCDRIGVMP